MNRLLATLFLGLFTLAGCSGSGGTHVPTVPSGPVATMTPTPSIDIYRGNPPSTAPPSAPATNSTSFTLTDGSSPSSPGENVGQYLIVDSGYTGALTLTNSCGSDIVASGTFENDITLQTGGGYSYAPRATGYGPNTILDVVGTGIFGPQTCTLSIHDTLGRTATIAVTNMALLLYRDQKGPLPSAGASGTGTVIGGHDQSASFLVYEQGYSGSYSLDPSSCAAFSATLTPGASPSDGALFTYQATMPNQFASCGYTVRSADGQSVPILAGGP